MAETMTAAARAEPPRPCLGPAEIIEHRRPGPGLCAVWVRPPARCPPRSPASTSARGIPRQRPPGCGGTTNSQPRAPSPTAPSSLLFKAVRLRGVSRRRSCLLTRPARRHLAAGPRLGAVARNYSTPERALLISAAAPASRPNSRRSLPRPWRPSGHRRSANANRLTTARRGKREKPARPGNLRLDVGSVTRLAGRGARGPSKAGRRANRRRGRARRDRASGNRTWADRDVWSTAPPADAAANRSAHLLTPAFRWTDPLRPVFVDD